jgi:hypothetical protein
VIRMRVGQLALDPAPHNASMPHDDAPSSSDRLDMAPRAPSRVIRGASHRRRSSSLHHCVKTSRGRPPAGPNGEKTSSYPQFSARLPAETLAQVRELSRARRVPLWRIIADAVDAYSEHHR